MASKGKTAAAVSPEKNGLSKVARELLSWV